ncbi:MAG: hypothetical protein AAF514_21585 [Verrucomicrobiota bacterium]
MPAKPPSKTGTLIFSLIILGLGIWMIGQPDLLEGSDVSGRRSLLKKMLIALWGWPGGIVLCLLGGLSLLGTLSDDNEAPKLDQPSEKQEE